MGISSKVTINGQTFKKRLRLNGANIVEQLVTGQLTAKDLERPTTWKHGGSLGGDQVTRLMGFNLAKNVKVAQKQESMAVAKYFQILVANTPMDDEYKYKDFNDPTNVYSEEQRARKAFIRKKLEELRTKPKKKKTQKDYDREYFLQDKLETFYEQDRENKMGIVTRTHKPDKDYVRGDWILTFRGVRFKAFETARGTSADVYFSMDDFKVVDDFKSITKIAQIIQEKTKDGVIGGGFKVSNDNPRAAMLEYGGYDADDSGPFVGTKYGHKHGVNDSHVWQAPKGFYRLTNALWNDIAKDTKTGRYQSYIRKWINADLSNFSVADIDGAEVKKLLKKKTVRTNEIDLNKLTKGKVK
jgi:hypothetical protein